MKLLGFLVSLLAHLLFILLIIHIQFPVHEVVVKRQIIEIIPFSPPPAPQQPPPAPPLVYVRPFVLKGGVPGVARGSNSGRGAGIGKGFSRPAFAAARVPDSSARGYASSTPTTAEPARMPGVKDKPTLSIDLDRIAKKLREKNSASEPAAYSGFSDQPGGKSLPFGDPAGKGKGGDGTVPGSGNGTVPGGGDGTVPGGGDGTASVALGGNAFFDARGYDITPWAKRMVYRVKRNWIFPPASAYGLKGVVGIYLLVKRDGSLSGVHIRKTSGVRPFDQAAFNAIELSLPLSPLPDDFPHEDLPAYFLFYYN